jgi:hypothetical protein
MIIAEQCDAREFPDVPFDVMIVDPPYSAHVHDRATSNHTAGAGPTKRDLGFAAIGDDLRSAIVTIAVRARRWSCVFTDIEGLHAWRERVLEARLHYVRAVPWVRWSQPQLSGDRPPSGAELAMLAHPHGAKRWSGPGSLTAFDTRSLRGSDKFPCEKPLDLMLSLVSWFSDAGETVVDPCCGSGTTGLAARLLGRDAILCDCDAAAVALARTKIGGGVSDRDRERCERWVEYQRAWIASHEPTTQSGEARLERAIADTLRVEAAL